MSEFTVEGRKKEKQRTGWEDEGKFFWGGVGGSYVE